MVALLPVLTIVKIEFVNTDSRVTAALEIGGRPFAVTLDFGRLPGVEIVSMPEEIQRHEAASRAVLDVLSKAHSGQAVSMPCDLSSVVRGAFEVWPTKVTVCESESAKRLSFALTRVRNIATGVVVLDCEVKGTASVVGVDIRDGSRSYFRFVRGVHPWHLKPDDVGAYIWHLAAAVKGPVSAQVGEGMWQRRVPSEPDAECTEILASLRPLRR